MTQGTRNSKSPLVSVDTLDFDALLAERSLEPKPVNLKGRTFYVRTDLTGQEMADYFRLTRAAEDRDVEALSILVGDDATDLNGILNWLPQKHMVFIVRKIMEAAGLITSGDDEGESEAS